MVAGSSRMAKREVTFCTRTAVATLGCGDQAHGMKATSQDGRVGKGKNLDAEDPTEP